MSDSDKLDPVETYILPRATLLESKSLEELADLIEKSPQTETSEDTGSEDEQPDDPSE